MHSMRLLTIAFEPIDRPAASRLSVPRDAGVARTIVSRFMPHRDAGTSPLGNARLLASLCSLSASQAGAAFIGSISKSLKLLARPARFELTTFAFGGRRPPIFCDSRELPTIDDNADMISIFSLRLSARFHRLPQIPFAVLPWCYPNSNDRSEQMADGRITKRTVDSLKAAQGPGRAAEEACAYCCKGLVRKPEQNEGESCAD